MGRSPLKPDILKIEDEVNHAMTRACVREALLEVHEQRWTVGTFHDLVAVVTQRPCDRRAKALVRLGDEYLNVAAGSIRLVQQQHESADMRRRESFAAPGRSS